MKIGLVLPYSIARGGGVQEIIKAMQKELTKRGHSVYIITPRPRDYDEEIPKNILLVGSSTDFRSPMHTTAQVSAGLNEDIDKILETHNFDILHFHEPWIPVLSRQILTRSKSVNVATFHAAVPDTIMSRSLVKVVTPYTRSLLKYIDSYTAVSDTAAKYICSLTDTPVAIIPNAVDLSQYKAPLRHHEKRKNKTILYIGRLEGRKGVKHLLNAYQYLIKQYPKVSLIVAGDGPEREKLEMLASDLKLDAVQFTGYISSAEKIKLLKKADLLCAPSLYGESFGIVLLEAMASGLVVVAGDNDGYKSVMQGFGAISLVSPKHTAEFARRLELLLYQPDIRLLWKNWAHDYVKQFDYPEIVDQYEQLYEAALKDNAQKTK
jgi:phosphatidylinositol alpha-mannosyltransferase